MDYINTYTHTYGVERGREMRFTPLNLSALRHFPCLRENSSHLI